jgi:hypothetical protein
MLVSRRNGTLTHITQPDHGRFAGVLGERWGNDDFARPSLREALFLTAAHHDDGWAPLDGEPVWNEAQQRPAHFLEVSLPVVAAAFKKGIDAIYEQSPVAGAVESLHFTGFYRSRWGVDDAPHVDHPDVAGIVEFEEDRRARAIRESWRSDRPRSDFERDIWHVYEILQVLDLVSLCVCLVDLERESSEDAEVMARTLFPIDQKASPRVILCAPRDKHGDRVDLTARVVAPRVVELDPFPFNGEITAEVPCRVLEERPYRTREEAAEAYHSAAVETRTCQVVGAGAAGG